VAGLNGLSRRDLAEDTTTETQTGCVLESLALDVDTISLPHRQTYGHNHKKSDRFQDLNPNLSQKHLIANKCQLFAIKFKRMSIYAYCC
jgi:hypothetical protein